MKNLLSILVNLFKLIPFIQIWLGVCLVIVLNDWGGLIGSSIAFTYSTENKYVDAFSLISGLILGSLLKSF